MSDPKDWRSWLVAPPTLDIETPLKEEWRLDSSEIGLFDHWAQEHTGIEGITVEFWSLDVKGSKIDPLYGESLTKKWKGPFKLRAYVQWAEDLPESREEGTRNYWNGSLWVPRKTLEDVGAPCPDLGDIVRYWRSPFFDKDEGTMGLTNVPNSGWYFDITAIDDLGHMHDNAEFTGVKCDIVRRTEYTPERRLLNR